MAEGNPEQPIDLDEYVRFTRCKRTFHNREDAFNYFCEKYAHVFEKMAANAMPGRELSASLSEIATVVKSGKTRRYILRRNKAKWSKVLDTAIKKAQDELKGQEKNYETLERQEDREDFANTVLARAGKRDDTAEKAGKLHAKLIADAQEHLEDE